MRTFFLSALFSMSTLFVHAQKIENANTLPYSKRFSIQTGMLQSLLLKGQNIVVAYNSQRWVFDWSHGNSLDYESGHHLSLNKNYNDQKLNVHVPWSTGPSLGYRITPYFNIRAEFKAHRHEVKQLMDNSPVAKYTTYTVGVGAFYGWYPFRKKDNWLQGILVEPVVRFWPNIGKSEKDGLNYLNTSTHKTETLSDYKLGFLANINIGYTFGGK